MSKIALTPNASGTGVFTIASPATNTDRTLTLPDEAGTVLTSASSLASANLTGAVTVSGSNVGIGTSSPALTLALSGGTGSAPATSGTTQNGTFRIRTAANGVLDMGSVSATGAGWLQATDQTNLASSYNLLLNPNGGNVGIGTSSPNSYGGQTALTINGSSYSRVDFNTGGTKRTSIYSEGSSNLIFETANTERMRIDSSGNLLVGTTNATGRIVSNTTGSYPFVARNGGGTSGYFGLIEFRNNADNAAVGSVVRVNDNSTAYNTSSDYRLKTDAQPMTGASDRVLALNPVNFEWISSGDRVDGFLAHEAQAVVPECVTGTKDAMRDQEYEVTAAVYEDIIIAAVLDEEGNELEAERTEQRLVSEAVMGTRSVPDYQGIDQSKLVPLLTAALQEALTEISALKVRVAALEAV